MNSFTLVLFILLVWVALYAIYFNFLRPVALTRLSFWVSEASDELDILLLAGRADPKSEAVMVLRGRIEKAQQLIPVIDTTTILLAASSNQLISKAKIEEEEVAIRCSTSELKAIGEQLDKAVCGAFCANSPFLIGAAVMVLLGLAMFSAFARRVQHWITQSFWNTIYAKNTARSGAVSPEDPRQLAAC